jgi:hypothetical protein
VFTKFAWFAEHRFTRDFIDSEELTLRYHALNALVIQVTPSAVKDIDVNCGMCKFWIEFNFGHETIDAARTNRVKDFLLSVFGDDITSGVVKD